MEEPFSFGAWLRQRRKALDLTQAELAHQVGCATSTLQKIELDERRPSKAMVERLAVVFAVPAAECARFLQSARGALAADQFSLPSAPRDPPAPWHAAVPPLRHLPVPLTPLIGRAREVADVVARLRQPEVRLLTLTGPGGSGKTRVALAAAMSLGDTFPDGITFVALAPITDPVLVLPAIAQALGVQEGSGRPLQETLPAALRDRHLLLVLDNCEQVLSAAVHIADLLRAAPSIKILATSRAPLQIQGEYEFAVPPLSLPTLTREASIAQVTHSEAGTLFIARVQAIRRDFTVTTANAPTIAAICRRLDGLPLAIELAARRCKVFLPQALLAHLDHRLEVLTGGTYDLPTRQQTLRATIDWSYNLLTSAEQRLFGQLAVFVGGWTLAAAEAVCRTTNQRRMEVVTGMQALLDHSLLQAEGCAVNESGAESRVTMLETIREYAHEVLEATGEAERMGGGHAAYYLELAETASPELIGPDQLEWLARLDVEHDNLRAALTWTLERNAVEVGLRLSAALHWFWVIRGHLSEGRRWLDALLARSDQQQVPAAVLADARLVAGDLAVLQGDLRGGVQLLDASRRLYEQVGDGHGMARSLHHLVGPVGGLGDLQRSRALLDESLIRYRVLADTRGIAGVLILRAWVIAHGDGRFDLAQPVAEESVRLFREVGDWRGLGIALLQLGFFMTDQGKYEQGIASMEEALGLARHLGDKPRIVDVLNFRALIADRDGDFGHATTLLEEALALAREIGDTGNVRDAIMQLGVTARYQGKLAQAQALLEEAVRLEEGLGNFPFSVAMLQRYQGDLAYDQGESARARQLYAQSLAIFRDLGEQWDCAACLDGLAAVAGCEGQAARAVRLWSASMAIRDALRAPLPPADRPRRDRALASLRATLGTEAFEATWAEGQALTPGQAIASALDSAR